MDPTNQIFRLHFIPLKMTIQRMSQIAPGGDAASHASRQAAQQMVQAAKITQAVKAITDQAGSSEVPRMKLATQKIIHTPETPADYAQRVKMDKEIRNLKLLKKDQD